MAFINVVSSMSFEKILKGKEKNLWVKREMLARQTGPSHRHLEQGYTPNVFNISTNWLAWMKGRQFNITMICLLKFIKREEKLVSQKRKAGQLDRQLIYPCRPCYCYCCLLLLFLLFENNLWGKSEWLARQTVPLPPVDPVVVIIVCYCYKARGWPDRQVLPPVVKHKTPNAEAASLILTQQIQSNITDSHSINIFL